MAGSLTTEEINHAWADVYLQDKIEGDPHQQFADRIGATRAQAKVMCHLVMIKSAFLKNQLKDH